MTNNLYTLDEFVTRANRELCKQDTCKQDNRMQQKITAEKRQPLGALEREPFSS